MDLRTLISLTFFIFIHLLKSTFGKILRVAACAASVSSRNFSLCGQKAKNASYPREALQKCLLRRLCTWVQRMYTFFTHPDQICIVCNLKFKSKGKKMQNTIANQANTTAMYYWSVAFDLTQITEISKPPCTVL